MHDHGALGKTKLASQKRGRENYKCVAHYLCFYYTFFSGVKKFLLGNFKKNSFGIGLFLNSDNRLLYNIVAIYRHTFSLL